MLASTVDWCATQSNTMSALSPSATRARSTRSRALASTVAAAPSAKALRVDPQNIADRLLDQCLGLGEQLPSGHPLVEARQVLAYEREGNSGGRQRGEQARTA
jgi:hypothetical protein